MVDQSKKEAENSEPNKHAKCISFIPISFISESQLLKIHLILLFEFEVVLKQIVIHLKKLQLFFAFKSVIKRQSFERKMYSLLLTQLQI